MARRGRLCERLIDHLICEEYRTIVCLYYEPKGGRSVIWGTCGKRGSGYVRVGLRPLLRLALGKVAVAAGTRVPYASPGALT
jgi:hypothetical protein